MDLMLNILPETMTTKSHRGGHLYFRIDYPIRKFTLNLGKYGKLEVAGQGQISVLPPSIHREGTIYEFIRKREPALWRGDIKQELKELLEAKLNVKIKRELINIEKLLEGVSYGERDESAIKVATWHRKQGLGKKEVTEKLREWNEKCNPPYGQHPSDNIPLEKWIQIKVESAFKPSEPYHYRFKGESRQAAKPSPGEVLGDYIFEQIGKKYIVFNKKDLRVEGEKDSFNGYKPLIPCLLTMASSCEPFERLESLWNEIRRFVYDHVDLREDKDYDILTAWVLATWTPELWSAVPYLFFYGPVASGKTWALEVLKELAFRSFISASASPAVLYYICEDWRPTLFLDETEIYLREHKADVVNLLNSGYRKGQHAVRVGEPDRKTGARKILTFKVFGFKALAGTREFVETLKSRCIIINMAKAVRKIVSKINKERAEHLRNQLLMYRFIKLSSEEVTYSLPEDLRLNGRLRELFEPLIIVAPEQMRQKMIRIAEKTQEIQEEEEKLSIEATVFHAIIKAYELYGKEGKVSVRAVTDVINAANPDIQSQIESKTVGYVSSRLGFRKTMYRHQRCVIWDKKLVKRLAQRYPLERAERTERAEVPRELKGWLNK